MARQVAVKQCIGGHGAYSTSVWTNVAMLWSTVVNLGLWGGLESKWRLVASNRSSLGLKR